MSIDLSFTDTFAQRHIGPTDADVDAMLDTLGYESLDALVDATIPDSIRTDDPLDLPPAITEQQVLDDAEAAGEKNENWRSFIGMGYHGTHTPPVIQRNILENPAWYTQYTPYQSEIAQGRLEALLNFQDMTIDLTGMEIANASLLDEATAAAEAMMMLERVDRRSDADQPRGRSRAEAGEVEPDGGDRRRQHPPGVVRQWDAIVDAARVRPEAECHGGGVQHEVDGDDGRTVHHDEDVTGVAQPRRYRRVHPSVGRASVLAW